MKTLTQIVTIAAAVGISGVAQAALIDVVATPGAASVPLSGDNS
jgi:hypothetical protein